MKCGVVLATIAGSLLAGCGERAPQATAYFAAHLDEARSLVDACRAGTKRGAECANADAAVQAADGRERFKHFRGD